MTEIQNLVPLMLEDIVEGQTPVVYEGKEGIVSFIEAGQKTISIRFNNGNPRFRLPIEKAKRIVH
jgi:hypothetical protein